MKVENFKSGKVTLEDWYLETLDGGFDALKEILRKATEECLEIALNNPPFEFDGDYVIRGFNIRLPWADPSIEWKNKHGHSDLKADNDHPLMAYLAFPFGRDDEDVIRGKIDLRALILDELELYAGDVEKHDSVKAFAGKLRELADEIDGLTKR